MSLNKVSELTDEQKHEISAWAEAEASKAKMRSTIHGFTDLCFNKCVTSGASSELNSNETQCIKNCVERFIDTNTAIVQEISRMQ